MRIGALISLVLLFGACCPKIVPISTEVTHTTKIDTVYRTDTVRITEQVVETDFNAQALCDSLFKANADTIRFNAETNAETQKQPQVGAVIFVKDSAGIYRMQLELTAYELLIDSLQTEITIRDSVNTVTTNAVYKCSSKFHIFTVWFFGVCMALLLVLMVVKFVVK